MKKYEVLYDWLRAQIAHVSDSSTADDFSATLVGQPLDDFVALTERIRNYGVEVATAKAERLLLAAWGEVASSFVEFEHKFPEFPGFHRNSLVAFCCVAGWLCVNHAPVLDDVEVDEHVFEVRTAAGIELAPVWFLHQNSAQMQDSLIVFDSREAAIFDEALSSSGISQELAFEFLATLSIIDEDIVCPSVLVKRTVPQIDLKDVVAFVELHLAMAGLPTHSPKLVIRMPSVVDKDSIRPESAYRQWSDVLLVLSEYNSRRELLLKYLTIYHVVESLMFKMPIVELEQKKNGAMFSIRDFRRLYDSVSVKELPALEKVFAMAFELNATPTKKYRRLVSESWNSLLVTHGSVAVDAALHSIGHDKNSADFMRQSAHGNYAKLVYFVRNSIVHNKETEFHLTSQSLSPGIAATIEEFLLPTLEQISFGMIGVPNNKLWYGNKELVLY